MRTNNYDPTPLVAGTNTIMVCDEARQNAGGACAHNERSGFAARHLSADDTSLCA